MSHSPTCSAQFSTRSTDQVLKDFPLECELFPAFWRVVSDMLSQKLSIVGLREIKTAQNINNSSHWWTRKGEREANVEATLYHSSSLYLFAL